MNIINLSGLSIVLLQSYNFLVIKCLVSALDKKLIVLISSVTDAIAHLKNSKDIGSDCIPLFFYQNLKHGLALFTDCRVWPVLAAPSRGHPAHRG